MNVIMESDRLLFVKVCNELVDDYLVMVNDLDTQRFLSAEQKVYTKDEELDWVHRKLTEGKDIVYSLIDKDTNKFVGNISLMDVEEDTAELGIVITREYQNKHYGMEAMKRILEYVKEDLKLKTITLIVYSNNERAIHCYEKLGFIITKIEKNVAKINGESVDDLYMIKKIA